MNPRTILTVGEFFLSVASTLVSYTLLSYLSTFIPAVYFGLTIAGGGIMATTTFFFLPRLVARFGAQPLALYLGFAEMIALFAVAASPETIASAILIVLVVSLQPILYYELDLLLEAVTDSSGEAGRVRTFFLTGGNLGALAAPLLIGTLLANTEDYAYVFFAAAVAAVPFVVLFSSRRLPKGDIPDSSHVSDTFKHLTKDRDLAAVTIGHLILYLFYIWAPLYVPVYLHVVLGIPWATLGWIFSIMLLPYILIEYPAGWFADNVFGDKRLMLLGFVVMGAALATVSLITASSPVWFIALVLFGTRAGAALVESMTEGHFFRCVSEKDIISVSVFRGVWPLANAIAPLIASVILLLGDYKTFFTATGWFIISAGVFSIFFIRDFNPKDKVCPPRD